MIGLGRDNDDLHYVDRVYYSFFVFVFFFCCLRKKGVGYPAYHPQNELVSTDVCKKVTIDGLWSKSDHRGP